MKRLFLFSYFLLLILSPVFAQVGEPRTDLAIGGSGGVALNSVSFKPSVKQEHKTWSNHWHYGSIHLREVFQLALCFSGRT